MTIDLKLGWTALADLERKFGEAFYLLNTDLFRRNFLRLQEAFRFHYQNSWIAYSYKTNYTPRLCSLVNELGGFAEVVSELEFDLAFKLGVPGERIIYNGPLKSTLSLQRCLQAGGLVNIDSLEELEKVESIAAILPSHPLALGIRCNFDIGETEISRFGIDTESEDFPQAIRRLRRLPNLKILGLHCHFPFRRIETYSPRIDNMLRLAREHFPMGLDFLDIGGGYFGDIDEPLRSQFSFQIPTYQDYADLIAPRMNTAFAHLDPNLRPRLILEPGTALVADAMNFVAKIMAIKNIRNKKIAIVAGSKYNISPTSSHINLPIQIINRMPLSIIDAPNYSVDLSGYTCIEADYLFRNYVGHLEVGDFAAFSNVGSYSVVMKPPFIQPCCPVIEIDGDNIFSILKRQETFNDIFSTFSF